MDLNYFSFYLPGLNFLIFLLLFFLAFRSLFSGMARKQREVFLKARSDAEREKKLAENKLQELLYKEQELAKKLQAMTEQAREDSRIRSEQMLEDARLYAAKLKEESERYLHADYLSAKKQLYDELNNMVDQLLINKVERLSTKAKHGYLGDQLSDLSALRQQS
ncbi:MAG: hypothetical protein OXC40_07035 [Proteobacteria bacterium]|nr:hypothetical protein [Pseudomonadota bacterium]